MKENDIRLAIEHFLQATARKIVVPASVGLGLTASGCDSTGLHAGRDAAAQVSDATTVPGADVADAATDVPPMIIPYIVRLPPDDVAADQMRAGESEAGAYLPDAEVDASVPIPPLIYVYYMPRAKVDATSSPNPVATPPALPEKA